jgi:tRNA-specific adenosine deaminase 1
MELTMALQDDSTPWEPPREAFPVNSQGENLLHGRSYFSSLGQVRRKPSRPDAPPTFSKSCTDKLALKQCTSLLSATTSLLISPQNMYLRSLILPVSQLSDTAIARAFSTTGRMSPLADDAHRMARWKGSGHVFHPLKVFPTTLEFIHSRRQLILTGNSLTSSNISAAWTPRFCETLIGGTIQGRKQFSLKGASRVCKRRAWKLALGITSVLGDRALKTTLESERYELVKQSSLLDGRRRVKEDVIAVLGGWPRNVGGDDFTVDGVE